MKACDQVLRGRRGLVAQSADSRCRSQPSREAVTVQAEGRLLAFGLFVGGLPRSIDTVACPNSHPDHSSASAPESHRLPFPSANNIAAYPLPNSLSNFAGAFKQPTGMPRMVNIDRDTPMLLPPDLREWVPADNMVHFVIKAIGGMDLPTLHLNRRGNSSKQ